MREFTVAADRASVEHSINTYFQNDCSECSSSTDKIKLLTYRNYNFILAKIYLREEGENASLVSWKRVFGCGLIFVRLCDDSMYEMFGRDGRILKLNGEHCNLTPSVFHPSLPFTSFDSKICEELVKYSLTDVDSLKSLYICINEGHDEVLLQVRARKTELVKHIRNAQDCGNQEFIYMAYKLIEILTVKDFFTDADRYDIIQNTPEVYTRFVKNFILRVNGILLNHGLK